MREPDFLLDAGLADDEEQMSWLLTVQRSFPGQFSQPPLLGHVVTNQHPADWLLMVSAAALPGRPKDRRILLFAIGISTKQADDLVAAGFE